MAAYLALTAIGWANAYRCSKLTRSDSPLCTAGIVSEGDVNNKCNHPDGPALAVVGHN